MKVFVLALTLFTSACAIGPDYLRPGFMFQDKWDALPTEPDIHLEENWWHFFGDETLNQLVKLALVNNHDLQIAKARILEARGSRLTAFGNLLPSVDGELSSSKNQDVNQNLTGGLLTNWELDIFGGNRRALQAANATLQSQKATAHGVQLSLISETIQTYLAYRRLMRQHQLTEENLTLQQAVLTTVQAQQEEGIADLFDVSRIQAQVAETEAALPNLITQHNTVANNLAVLVGLQPHQIRVILATETQPELTTFPEAVLNLPAAIIQNRPDVIAAEQNLIAATANQGVAMSNWFPSFNISSLIGFQTTPATGNADTWSLGGTIGLSLIDFGRVRGQIRQADARQDIALATYEQTIITAIAEIESNAVSYQQAQRRLTSLATAQEAAIMAEQIARVHFEEGLKSLLDVLIAQQTRLSAETNFTAGQIQVYEAYVLLNQSIGSLPKSEL